MGHSLIPGWGPQIPQASKQENSKNLKKKKKRGLSLDAGGWRVEAVALSSCQMNSHIYPSPPW